MIPAIISQLALPLVALAQQTSFFFIDSQPDQQWAASVAGQDACGTTLDLVCTAGTASLPANYGPVSCDPSGFQSNFASAAVTYSGTSIYEVSQSFAILQNGGIEMQVTETCSIYGTSSAICKGDASVSTAGLQTLIPVTTTYSGDEASAKFFQVPITGGSITPHTAQCSSVASFMTPTESVQSASQSYATACATASRAGEGSRVEVWRVVVVPVALLAGLPYL